MKIQPTLIQYNQYRNIKPENITKTNFKATIDNQSFEKELLELDEVHCPLCGTKMLNDKNTKTILKEAESIETPSQLDKFFTKNKDYMPVYAKKLSVYTKNLITEKPDISLKEITYKLFAMSISDNKKAVITGINYLNKLQKEGKFSENDNVLIDECKIRLGALTHYRGPKFDYSEFIKILNETLANTDAIDKAIIYERLKTPVKNTALTTRVFKHTNENFAGKEIYQIIKNIFDGSKQNLSSVLPDEDYKYDPNNNKILLCQSCNTTNRAALKKFSATSDLENFKQYQKDIAKHILEGKLKGNEKYPFHIAGLVSSISPESLKGPKNTTLRGLKAHVFYIDRKAWDFAPTNYPGITCASCGNETITHEKKLKLYQKIIDAKNIYELKVILNQNKEHIGKKYHKILTEIDKELAKKPEITEDELLSTLQKTAKENIQNEINKNALKIIEFSKNFNLSANDIRTLNLFQNTVYKDYYEFNYDEKFNFNDYEFFTKKFLQSLETEQRSYIISELKEDLRIKYFIQSILFAPQEAVKKTGSDLKVVVQNLIKTGVATTDHVIAKDKNGENKLGNLTVMCSSCNREKSNYNFKYWLKLHPEMKQNLQKYLNRVKDLIKKGKIEGYENYPQEFSENIKEITNNYIDLKY